ncbi:MAG: ankyrin repeat domain-containing protein [Alphaproteobacteria bacterium]|nr:ankyrin repeat domain-containing protein [Alphaproteobacteria bacterium]
MSRFDDFAEEAELEAVLRDPDKAAARLFQELEKTPLFEAVDEALFSKLIAALADPDCRGKNESTPLILLSANPNDTNMLQQLLDKGADINAQNTLGNTALTVAATWECKENISLLIAAGADPNIKGDASSVTEEIQAFIKQTTARIEQERIEAFRAAANKGTTRRWRVLRPKSTP